MDVLSAGSNIIAIFAWYFGGTRIEGIQPTPDFAHIIIGPPWIFLFSAQSVGELVVGIRGGDKF